MSKVLFILLLAILQIQADVQLASIFKDHMVIQQNKPLVIWGEGTPEEQVQIKFGQQSQTSTVNQDGKWQVTLKAMGANKQGQSLWVKAKNELEVKDILIGEVWICSGQSNMAMGYNAVPELKALYPQPKNGLLRSLIVPTMVAFTPQSSFNAQWKTVPPTSAVAYAFSYHLQKNLDIPVGIIQTAWGSSSIEGWMPIELTETLPHFKAAMQKFEKNDRKKVDDLLKKKKWERNENIYLRTRPNILYNAMLHPIIPFAVRGMVWYQGESNSGRPLEYQQSLPIWITKLRELWKQPDFHFMAVMLPRYGRGANETTLDRPDTQSWNRFREAQCSILTMPHTNVANTIDLGDVKDIHPKDKAPIGLRLAKMVERDIHQKTLLGQGPLFQKVDYRGKQAIVHFDFVDQLKTTDGKSPKAFWLAGDNKKWHQAEASIQGQQIVLSSPAVSNPVAVRYAYAAFPEVNLVNGEGFPAYPFRSDSW
jgi:sialate O-acetylesterase